jgi:transposase
VPGSTILEISQPEQEWMLAELRRARHGDFLALQVLLLCTAGRTPTEIASGLFCSRSSVYRIVRAYREHGLGQGAQHRPGSGAGAVAVTAPQFGSFTEEAPIGLRVGTTGVREAARPRSRISTHKSLLQETTRTVMRAVNLIGTQLKKAA